MACECKPGKPVCKSCLTSVYDRNVSSLTAVTYVNGNGEYTINQVNEFEKKFKQNIIVDTQNNPLSGAVRRYGEKEFYDSVNSINNDFLKRAYIAEQLPKYEVLNKRLQSGPISPLEFAAFIKDSNYTPGSVIASSNAAGSRFLNELEEFYNGDFSNSVMGGFCAMFGSVFGAIGGFFDLIDGVSGLIQDAMSFLNKLRNIENPLEALFEKIKVQAILDAIKEKITSTISKTIEKVQKMVENFNPANIMGEIENFVQKNIVEKVQSIQNQISNFFSEENKEKILGKINGLIDYATGLFDNPSLEEIMFMVSRFCALATGVEGLIKGLKAPLDDFSNRYDEVFNTLSNASNRITGEAIRAGAIRFSDDRRKEEINNQKQVWAQVRKTGSQTPAQTTTTTAATGATFTPAPASNDIVVGAPTSKEISSLPTWEDIVDGKDSRFKSTRSLTFGSEGKESWNNLTMDTKIALLRLHKGIKPFINGPIEISVGWLSAEAIKLVPFSLGVYGGGTCVKIKWEPWGKDQNSVLQAWETAKMIGVKRFVINDYSCTIDMAGKTLFKNNMQKSLSTPTPTKKSSDTSWPAAGEANTNYEDYYTVSKRAKKKAIETKSNSTFVHEGRTYKVTYKPSTREPYTNDQGVLTEYPGGATVRLVRD